MADLTDECPTASQFLFIAVRGQGGEDSDECAYAWWIFTPDGKPAGSGNNTLDAPIKDWPARAILPIVTQAVREGNIGAGGHLHVVSDERYFADILNEDRAIRRQNGYRGAGDFLKGKEWWQKLDDEFDQLDLGVSAGRPVTQLGCRTLASLKVWVGDLRRNISNSDDWNLNPLG